MKTPEELFPAEGPYALTETETLDIEADFEDAKRRGDARAVVEWTYRSPQPKGYIDAVEVALLGAGWTLERDGDRLLVNLPQA